MQEQSVGYVATQHVLCVTWEKKMSEAQSHCGDSAMGQRKVVTVWRDNRSEDSFGQSMRGSGTLSSNERKEIVGSKWFGDVVALRDVRSHELQER